MITFSSLEPFALSSLLLAAVLGKLGKLGEGRFLNICFEIQNLRKGSIEIKDQNIRRQFKIHPQNCRRCNFFF